MPRYLLSADLQSAIKWIEGSPEGLINAPPGQLICDGVTGDLYQKKTSSLVNTGWAKIGLIGAGTGIRIKNSDTGLWHTLSLVGAAGEETIQISTPGDVNP
jgi:hypothetical protein